jgi:hypothetical protein
MIEGLLGIVGLLHYITFRIICVVEVLQHISDGVARSEQAHEMEVFRIVIVAGFVAISALNIRSLALIISFRNRFPTFLWPN